MHKFTKHQKVKGKRKHGFRARMSSHTGQKIISRRREKRRSRIAV